MLCMFMQAELSEAREACEALSAQLAAAETCVRKQQDELWRRQIEANRAKVCGPREGGEGCACVHACVCVFLGVCVVGHRTRTLDDGLRHYEKMRGRKGINTMDASLEVYVSCMH